MWRGERLLFRKGVSKGRAPSSSLLTGWQWIHVWSLSGAPLSSIVSPHSQGQLPSLWNTELCPVQLRHKCPWHNWILGWSTNPSLWPQYIFSQDSTHFTTFYTMHTYTLHTIHTAHIPYKHTSHTLQIQHTLHTYTYTKCICTYIYILHRYYTHCIQRDTPYTQNTHNTHISYRQCL